VYLCLFRLVPNLVALILFCTFILPWIGTGPLWNQVVRHHSDICKNTWWRNLLFIHNYFGFETMVSLTIIQSNELILKQSDIGILHYPFLGFWTLSIIWYSEQNTNVLGTGSIFCLRMEKGPVSKLLHSIWNTLKLFNHFPLKIKELAYDIKQFRAALKAFYILNLFILWMNILILIRIVLVSYDFIIGSHGYVNMLKICIVYIFIL
jgi:hypothetical protein